MHRRLNPNASQIVEIRTDVPSAWAGWSFSANGRHLGCYGWTLWSFDALAYDRGVKPKSRFGAGQLKWLSSTLQTGMPGTSAAALVKSLLLPVASTAGAWPLHHCLGIVARYCSVSSELSIQFTAKCTSVFRSPTSLVSHFLR